MIKINHLVVAGAMITLVACGGKKETETGLGYQFHEENEDARLIQKGDFVEVSMVYKTEGDSILFNSSSQGAPIRFRVQDPLFKGELMEGLVMMHEGDSATFWVNADSLYAKTQAPLFNRPGEKIVFDLKVIKVSTQAEMQKRIDDERLKKVEEEKLVIQEYVTKSKLPYTSTGSGLMYHLTNKGYGAIAKNGDEVTVKYVGKHFDGSTFDPGKEPFTFVVGQGQVIAGWDEAFALLPEGAKGTLIVPSHLGYGERGAGEEIRPFEPLMFEVELLKVTKK